jgi:hypothetical protein
MQSSKQIDFLPIREALRMMRHGFRRSGRVVKRASRSVGGYMPFPRFAETVFSEFEVAAKDVDRVTSSLGRKFLHGATADRKPHKDAFSNRDENELGSVAYAALVSILRHVSLNDVYVSEAAARRIFAEVLNRSDSAKDRDASSLFFGLLDGRVIGHGVGAGSGGRISAAVAIFALLLWLQSDCSDPYEGEALFAAADLAVALKSDLAAAIAARDEQHVSKLLDEFSPHV